MKEIPNIPTIMTEFGVLLNATQVKKFYISNDKALFAEAGKGTNTYGIIADMGGGDYEVVATCDSPNKAKSTLLKLQMDLSANNDDTLISF